MSKKIVDIIIVVGLILAIVVGLLTAKNFRATAEKQIESKSNIEFEVFLRTVTLTSAECPIKVGDTTFISIRNVPYSDLEIVGVKFQPKQVVLPVKSPKGYITVNDASQADTYDITVRVKDVANITKDGAVVGGNKIKIGMPITLEGKVYKITGTVSDICINDEVKE